MKKIVLLSLPLYLILAEELVLDDLVTHAVEMDDFLEIFEKLCRGVIEVYKSVGI